TRRSRDRRPGGAGRGGMRADTRRWHAVPERAVELDAQRDQLALAREELALRVLELAQRRQHREVVGDALHVAAARPLDGPLEHVHAARERVEQLALLPLLPERRLDLFDRDQIGLREGEQGLLVDR